MRASLKSNEVVTLSIITIEVLTSLDSLLAGFGFIAMGFVAVVMVRSWAAWPFISFFGAPGLLILLPAVIKLCVILSSFCVRKDTFTYGERCEVTYCTYEPSRLRRSRSRSYRSVHYVHVVCTYRDTVTGISYIVRSAPIRQSWADERVEDSMRVYCGGDGTGVMVIGDTNVRCTYREGKLLQ